MVPDDRRRFPAHADEVRRAASDGAGGGASTRDAADVRAFYLSPDGRTLYSVGPTRDDVIAAEEAEYDDGVRLDPSTPIDSPCSARDSSTDGCLPSVSA